MTVPCYWRLVQPLRHNLPLRGINLVRPIGDPNFETSEWSPGEAVRQSVTFRVPADAAPGVYPLHAGVWLPWTGKQLRASRTDLPVVRRAVVIGSPTVRP